MHARGRTRTVEGPLLTLWRGHSHSVTPEDFKHRGNVGRPSAGGVDHLGGFAKILGAQYRGADDDELFYVFAGEIIEAVESPRTDA